MFMALLLTFLLIIVLVAWSGKRSLSLSLFAVFMVLSIAVFIHHMSDVIGLSL